MRLRLVILAGISIAGCSGLGSVGADPLIPVPAIHFKLSDLWSNWSAASGSLTATIPPLPDVAPQIGSPPIITFFPSPPSASGQTVPVPAWARGQKVRWAGLVFTATNNYPIPVKLQVFIDPTSPYANDKSPTVLTLGASPAPNVVSGSHDIPPSWFAESSLQVGFGLSSGGSTGLPVNFAPDLTVDVESSLQGIR